MLRIIPFWHYMLKHLFIVIRVNKGAFFVHFQRNLFGILNTSNTQQYNAWFRLLYIIIIFGVYPQWPANNRMKVKKILVGKSWKESLRFTCPSNADGVMCLGRMWGEEIEERGGIIHILSPSLDYWSCCVVKMCLGRYFVISLLRPPSCAEFISWLNNLLLAPVNKGFGSWLMFG